MKKNPLVFLSFALAVVQFILVSILAVMVFTYCSDPIPTELTDNDETGNKVTLQVIAENPGIYVYTNGYDSTGIVEPLLDKTTYVSVTGIRNTNYGARTIDDYYYTQFSDKNNPVLNRDKNIIGFPGVNMGEVRFNNNLAPMAENKVKFNDHNRDKDTTAGLMYSYSSKQSNPSGNSQFPYNSVVSFRLDQKTQGPPISIQFDIKTPEAIVGKVAIQGETDQKNLKMNLQWNGQNGGDIDVIIGLFNENSKVYPLYKLTAKDNGTLSIPETILNKIAEDNNKEILVTFIRKKLTEETREVFKDNYIVAQSIHNIKIQLP